MAEEEDGHDHSGHDHGSHSGDAKIQDVSGSYGFMSWEGEEDADPTVTGTLTLTNAGFGDMGNNKFYEAEWEWDDEETDTEHPVEGLLILHYSEDHPEEYVLAGGWQAEDMEGAIEYTIMMGEDGSFKSIEGVWGSTEGTTGVTTLEA